MARLMSPNNGETAVHGCHCPGDMAVRMREVLARALVGVCVSPALSLSYLALLTWGDFHARSCFLALLSLRKNGDYS